VSSRAPLSFSPPDNASRAELLFHSRIRIHHRGTLPIVFCIGDGERPAQLFAADFPGQSRQPGWSVVIHSKVARLFGEALTYRD
jgi:hypothetical protein